MKNKSWILFLWVIAVYMTWLLVYPEILASFEANSFFVATPDYFNQMLTLPGGLGSLCGNFVAQFFRWREMGALIIALMTLIIAWSSWQIIKSLNVKNGQVAALFISIVFAIVQLKWFSLITSVQFIFFFLALYLYVLIRKKNIRLFLALVYLPCMAWLLPSGLGFLFFIFIAVLEYRLSGFSWIFVVIPIAEAVSFLAIPYLWSRLIAFVPANLYLTFVSVADENIWPVIAITLISGFSFCLCVLLPLKKDRLLQISGIILIIIGIVVMSFDSSSRNKEYMAKIYSYAGIGQWGDIIEDIPMDKAHDNPLLFRYLLLAYSETGQLPDRLPEVVPLNTESFYFNPANKPEEKEFNSLFYEAIGIYNEAIHQTFERAIQSDNGMTFRSLRMLIDLNLKAGNVKIVEKYMEILRHSTCLGSWIQKREALLAYLKTHPVQQPDRTAVPTFIGSQPFVTEMGHLVNQDAQNLKKIDYLLCGLMLQNDKNRFKTVYDAVQYEKIRPQVPVCYQMFLGTK